MIDSSARGLAAAALAAIAANEAPTTTSSTPTPASTTSVTLATAKKRRAEIMVTNLGHTDLFIRLNDAAASLTTYDVRIEPGFTVQISADYEGAIQGIWHATGGQCFVTETF